MKFWKLIAMTAVPLTALAVTMPSYTSTAAGLLTSGIKNQVPIEFEIQRAADLLKRIEPEIVASRRAVAGEEVELESLQRDVARMREEIVAEGQVLKRGAKLVANTKLASLAATNTVYKDKVATDLKLRFSRFKHRKELLGQKEELLARQKACLVASQKKLHAVRGRKHELEIASST